MTPALRSKIGRIGRLVYVEWVDSGCKSGWCEPDPPQDESLQCVSVGWLTHQTKKAITLTAHVQLAPRFHNSDMEIPKCAITTMRFIT